MLIREPVSRPAGVLTAGDMVTFLVPAGLFLEFSLIGRLFVSELCLAAVCLLLILRANGRRPWDRTARTFVALAVVWLLAQIVTDLVRGTPFADWSRGWAKIGFTVLDFTAIYLLIGDSKRRILLFAVGLIFGGIATFYLSPNEFSIDYPWKFGIGFPITLLAVLVASTRKVRRFPLLPPFIISVMAVVNMTRGYRSLGGVCALAAAYSFLQAIRGYRNRSSNARLRPSLVVLAVLGGSMLSVGILQLYTVAASRGQFGSVEQTKLQQQSGDFGVLVGGRSELFFSTRAIRESPLIGYGSWAKASVDADALAALRRAGYQYYGRPSGGEEVYSHSYLFGSWVEAGVFGGLFWIWVMVLLGRVMLRLHRIRHQFGPLFAFMGASFLWDILFSPYGAQARLTATFQCVLMMFALRRMVPTHMDVPELQVSRSPG